MAETAERAGFDSVWVGDHLLYRGDDRGERGPWEAWTTLAALAAVTDRVELGPLVACAGFHRPAMLAKLAATVDEISGGRLVLGLGAGWNRPEFDAFGVPYDHRVSRFEEAFEIIRRLVAGERVTFDGRFHSVADVVLLPPPVRTPPIMIGSNGPRMLSIALPQADRWNSWWDGYGNTPDGFAELNGTISDAARAAGRDPADIDRSACVLYAPAPPSERPATDDAPPVVGGPDELAAHLAALADAGADEAILVLDPITTESIERAGAALTALDRASAPQSQG
jgi:probable F420-dependent oxidoreductase